MDGILCSSQNVSDSLGLQVCWVAYIHMYIGLAKALATLQRCSLISLFLALNEIKNLAFLA